MGEVDAVIPEKSTDSSETTSNSIINGEINGVCKTNEVMEIDTEDDSQISSGNSITATETESDIANKKNILINKNESSNSNSSNSNNSNSNSENSNSCSSSGSTNLKQNSKASLLSNSQSDNKKKEISSEISDENSQKSTKTNFSEENSKENGRIENEKNNKKQKETEKIEENKSETEIEQIPIEDEKNVSNVNDSSKMEVDCPSSEKNTNSSNIIKETQEKQPVEESSANNDSKNDKKENTASQSKNENSIQLEKSEVNLAKVEEAVVPMEVDSKSNKDDSSNKTTGIATTTTTITTTTTVGSNEEKKCIEENDDDDDAVLIPSDSESDNQDSTTDNKSKASTITKEPIKETEVSKNKKDTGKVIDDDVVEVLSDKDDCVVIEDDDKKDNSVRRTQRQRKNVTKNRDYSTFDDDDVTEIVDDSQPPSKRARTSEPSILSQPIGQIGQITIRDARSLMATPYQDNSSKQNFNQSFSQKTGLANQSLTQNSVSTKSNTAPYTVMPVGMQQQGVFPVNIRPALTPVSSTPPKLVSTSITPTVQNNLIQESPVLPNLTDDMFVLEAPSFIVPYIYEKPPSENLKEIVSKLATEAKEVEKELKGKDDNKKDDDKKDQSINEEKKNETLDAKKEKRKRKKPKNPDDSWGESDESTDDDASDAETRTKVLIKEVKNDITSIVTNTEALKQLIMGGGDGDKKSEDYFDSPLGKFFIDIGIGLVQEYVQADLLRQQKRKRDKARGSNTAEIEKAINSLKQNLQTSKTRNEPFKFEMRRCEYCNFKSESALVMANHYETPHMRQYMYKCNFCSFEAKPPHDILFHMEAIHNIKGRLDKAPSYHQCPNCPFEDNGKSKLARHLPVCAKKFRPEQNLLPPSDWEAPAKIPRIKPRHGLVGTATAYQAMAAQAAAQKAALAQFSQRSVTPNNNATNNAYMRNRGRPQQQTNPVTIRPPVPVVPPTNTRGVRQAQPGIVMPNVHMTGAQFIQVSGSNLSTVLPNSHNTLALQQQQNSKKAGNGGGQPSISITPLPRQPNNQSQNVVSNPISLQSSTISPVSSVQSKPVSTGGLKPGQGPSGSKTSFVICEICDGYIKDLEQLRNHMQWMHKVKIHPKMIYNRPPLNCQKCQFRFFTDQGLERHLLGSHGLVTSSMQEAANKGKDAGRCPVCGRMYQWKLLNHVSRDHHMTLKPAHLSYKCTVCTATFGMYKQFENHVYTAHSTVAKKAMDNKKNSPGNIGGNLSSIGNNSSNSIMNSGSTTIQRSSGGSTTSLSSLSGGNDSLLKPLKINDEITIIPQPATKSRGIVNEMESHVIDLSLSSSSSSSTTTRNPNGNKQSKNSTGYIMNHSNNYSNNNNNNNISNDDIHEISDDEEDDDDDEDTVFVTLPNGTKKKIWSLEETKYLIDCYKKYKHLLEKKQFKKDDLWFLINEDMKRAGFKNSSNQIKFKFDKLKRTYIKAKRRNRKTKYKPRAFQFMDEFDELFAQEEERRLAEKISTNKTQIDNNITTIQ